MFNFFSTGLKFEGTILKKKANCKEWKIDINASNLGMGLYYLHLFYTIILHIKHLYLVLILNLSQHPIKGHVAQLQPVQNCLARVMRVVTNEGPMV